MSDVVKNADGQQSDSATLSFPGGTAEFPIRPAVDGASSIDLSTLTRKTGLTGLDYGFVNTASTESRITSTPRLPVSAANARVHSASDRS